MKILIVTDQYFPTIGGIPTVIRRLSQKLSKKNKVAIIAPSTRFKNSITNENNVKIYNIRSMTLSQKRDMRVSPDIITKRRIKKIILNFSPDVIHIMTSGFIAFSAISIAKKSKIPLVGTMHMLPQNVLPYFKMPKRLYGRAEKLINNIYSAVYSNLDVITAPTEAAAKLFTKNNFKGNVIPLSNGLDLSSYLPKSGIQKKILEKKFNLSKTKRILYVGRLDKDKKVDVLVKSLIYLKNKLSFEAIIAGSGPEMENLKKLAKKNMLDKKIKFLGFVSDKDLTVLYQVCDIFVMPGTIELQSLATMEAMASGLPVIAADACALPHLVKNGQNGYLFVPNNTKDLANKLTALLSDAVLARKMGKESLILIKDHDIEKIVEKLENLYESAIDFKTHGVPRKKKMITKLIKDPIFINLIRYGVTASVGLYALYLLIQKKPKTPKFLTLLSDKK